MDAQRQIALICAEQMRPFAAKAIEETGCVCEWFGTGSTLAADIESAAEDGFDAIAAFESGACPVQTLAEEALRLATEPKAPRPVVVFGPRRKMADPAVRKLVSAGVDVVAGYEDAAGLLSALAKAVSGPSMKEELAAGKAEPEAPGSVGVRDVEAPEPVPDTRFMRKWSIVEGMSGDGSTHLTLMCAAALVALGFKVAVVLPEATFRELDINFEDLPKTPDGAGRILSGVSFFSGKTAADAVGEYEYSICDMGRAAWLWGIDEGEASRESAFWDSDACILSARMTPFGAFRPAMRGMNGSDSLLSRIPERRIARLRIAVSGVCNDAYDRSVRAALSARNPHIRYAAIPYAPNPLLTINRESGIPIGLLDLFDRLVPSAVLRDYAQSVQFEGAEEPKAPKRGLFGRGRK